MIACGWDVVWLCLVRLVCCVICGLMLCTFGFDLVGSWFDFVICGLLFRCFCLVWCFVICIVLSIGTTAREGLRVF